MMNQLKPEMSVLARRNGRIATLERELAEARRENLCDVCCGKGNPGTGKPCVCGGTGMASRQAQGFRESINDLHRQMEAVEHKRNALQRQNAELLREKARLDARIAALESEMNPQDVQRIDAAMREGAARGTAEAASVDTGKAPA